jgi:hypothetical protein
MSPAREFAPRNAAARARRRRSDAGDLRCSGRDLELLSIIGEQYAVSLPQLARLMGRSLHAARWLRSRWERGGGVGAGAGGACRSAGLRVANASRPARRRLGVFALASQSGGAGAHRRGHRRAALGRPAPPAGRLGVRTRAGPRGATHRERRAASAGRAGGARRAELPVEVELSHKRPARRERIMRELVARYGQVVYFAPDGRRQGLEETARSIGSERVQVLELPSGKETA